MLLSLLPSFEVVSFDAWWVEAVHDIWECVAVSTYLLNYLKSGPSKIVFVSVIQASGAISIPHTSYSLNLIQARGMAAIISLNLATLTNTVFKTESVTSA